ncbi:hypothetical protein CYMTET_40324 [Cymbomonas tetramitiformis]|uniref:Uncharacterized protein n=1 Tax=Cymbomonas tetramitiformis TaxID=36881 RepID=A0AAE0C9B2_9CHLO|nr:hypothetical protein CYMTET_40324 [Cymbomonas tetramitiformis]
MSMPVFESFLFPDFTTSLENEPELSDEKVLAEIVERSKCVRFCTTDMCLQVGLFLYPVHSGTFDGLSRASALVRQWVRAPFVCTLNCFPTENPLAKDFIVWHNKTVATDLRRLREYDQKGTAEISLCDETLYRNARRVLAMHDGCLRRVDRFVTAHNSTRGELRMHAILPCQLRAFGALTCDGPAYDAALKCAKLLSFDVRVFWHTPVYQNLLREVRRAEVPASVRSSLSVNLQTHPEVRVVDRIRQQLRDMLRDDDVEHSLDFIVACILICANDERDVHMLII